MLFLLIFSVIPNAVGVPAENNLQRIGDARGNNLPNIVARTKDGKFYLLQSTQGDMDWMKAEMQCLGYGDHLTSIHSDEENLEVGELCKVAAKGGEKIKIGMKA